MASASTYMKGKTSRAATIRVVTRKGTDGTPMVSRASISSLIRIVPSSATSPQPTLAPMAKPKKSGVISRMSQSALKTPARLSAPPN